ncbi:hypothetical protein [Mucilaginibacter sp.]
MKKFIAIAVVIYTIAVVSSTTFQNDVKLTNGLNTSLYVSNIKKDIGSAD